MRHGTAEQLILDKIRICYDTCHAAVMFETPESILGNYEKLGIRVGQVQISSGLVCQPRAIDTFKESGAFSLLKELSFDRYLHQVVGKDPRNGKFEFYSDLHEALLTWERGNVGVNEYRVHYHVPIFLERLEFLGTTQSHILDLLKLAKSRPITNHWEVETYTWLVLLKNFTSPNENPLSLNDSTTIKQKSPGYDSANLPGMIAQEINWVNRLSRELDS